MYQFYAGINVCHTLYREMDTQAFHINYFFTPHLVFREQVEFPSTVDMLFSWEVSFERSIGLSDVTANLRHQSWDPRAALAVKSPHISVPRDSNRQTNDNRCFVSCFTATINQPRSRRIHSNRWL